jgi:hypothetical protein
VCNFLRLDLLYDITSYNRYFLFTEKNQQGTELSWAGCTGPRRKLIEADTCCHILWEPYYFHIPYMASVLYTRLVFSALGFTLWSSAQHIKLSCAGLLSSAWYGNTELPQYIQCINRLRARCWFGCVQPLWKLCRGVQSRSGMKVWIRQAIKDF